MSSWPPENTEPTAASPWFCDGEYGPECLRVSPEGIVFGQMHWVSQTEHRIWWTGSAYKYVEITAQWLSQTDLPTTGNVPAGRIDQVREYVAVTNKHVWSEFWWDASNGVWKRLKWLWPIEGFANVPIPGVQAGAAHVVNEGPVLFFWDGYEFGRPSHGMLKDDEPNRHLPNGLLQFLTPDAKVSFISKSEIVLQTVTGGSGKVWVAGEYIQADASTTVFNDCLSLEWNSQTNSLLAAYMEPDTEYWIYLANNKTDAFVIPAMPGDATHGPTRSERVVTTTAAGTIDAWDFRGKLFLSRTADTNGYLSNAGAGLNAKLAGKVQTDATSMHPYFIQEANISLISQTANFAETLREFSDYRVEFVDQDNLILNKLDGLHGEIYIAEALYYLGSNYLITTSGPQIEWDQALDGRLRRDATTIVPGTRYYVYIAANTDPFNFNATNPNTNRPWQKEDAGAEIGYDASLDMRLVPFLSTKVPDHGTLSEEWPGYFTRHIGQVATDANGRFINARDLSAIRQPTLNPAYFDGLAECQIEKVSDTELRLVKKLATSGIINVAGEAIPTYERLELEDVQRILTTDVVQQYTEANLNGPLSDLDVVSAYAGQSVYVYIANTRTLWGAFTGKTFFTLSPPVKGYLARNWPGNQARWLATIKVSASGTFGQNFLTDSVSPLVPIIDDESNSPNTVLSSSKVYALVNKVEALIGVRGQYETQKTLGCSVMLEYKDSTHVTLKPAIPASVTIAFNDLTVTEVPTSGVSLELTGVAPGMIYHAYLTPDGLTICSDAPTEVFDQMETRLGDNAILVGWVTCGTTTNTMSGTWNVVSFWNEPDREWSLTIPQVAEVGAIVVQGGSAQFDLSINMAGFVSSKRVATIAQRTGQDTGTCWFWGNKNKGTISTPNNGFGEVHLDYYGSPYWQIRAEDATEYGDIVDAFVLRRTYWTENTNEWITHVANTGSFIITRKRVAA